MTEQEQSQFNQRADHAGLQLKAQLNQERGLNLQETKVEVGPDGQPPKPLPPEGSYARQAIEHARAQAQAQGQQAMAQGQNPTLGDQPPVGTVEQAIDGSQAPPVPTAQPPQVPGDQNNLSARANERFAALSQQLRDMDRERQAAIERAKHNDTALAEVKGQLEALTQQHSQMLQANLENLDPETRMHVMQDARMREYFANFKQEVLSEIQPQISGLQVNQAHDELMKLAGKYPRFDVQVHGPLIEMYRGKYPVPIEDAFKAVAEPDELVTRGAVSAGVVPPIVPAGAGAPVHTRYAPEPQSNPEQELIEEAAQIKKLMMSADPADHRMGQRLAEQNIAARLGDKLPGVARRQ